jgi:hypothetical protein
MGWIDARLAAGQDTAGTSVTHVQWSENGSSESSNLARTAITLKSATSAHPSVKENNGAATSASASGACTISHFAFSDGATRQTAWIALTTSRTLAVGDKLSIADGALKVNAYRSTAAPS